MIGIVDYGSGNIGAISNIYKQLKVDHLVVNNPLALDAADRYVLPGVGHFDRTMRHLKASGVYQALFDNVVSRGKPLLGICVGMQILGCSSEEGVEPGLGWIAGRVARIKTAGCETRLPHMGWNAIVVKSDRLGLFKDVDHQLGFYFLHSYHFRAERVSDVLAETFYGEWLMSAVTNNINIIGVQFHPEKSHRNGMLVFRNFARL
jgi:glutamine amidotransferase